jgi:glycosyltransferase involved in cell wall biosynthesis
MNSTESDPLISIVICTHNRAAYLGKAMASALDQDVPAADYELIVVDNCSTDDTAQVCKSFAAPNLRYVFEGRLGLCHARNAGWKAARGRYVAYLDDDAIAEPGWLAAIGEAFAVEPTPGVVGGKVDPIWEGPRPGWLPDSIACSLTIVDWPGGPKLIPDVRVEWLVGANMAMPKALLEQVGGFDPRLDRIGTNMLSGGDVFLQKQIIEHGHPCYYHPRMAVRHLVSHARLEKRWFTKRYYWQGISDAVMELIVERPSALGRLRSALARTGRLFAKPRDLWNLIIDSDDPQRFERRCFTLIAVGHIIGLLGAARA